MKTRQLLHGSVLLLLALHLGGCASNKVLYFGTDTSLGLNVSGTTQMPNKVSFAYERGEVAFVPRNPTGPAHSVLGTFDADINFFGDKAIYQVFAIGQAAESYASKVANLPMAFTEPKATGSGNVRDSLVFVTHTATGLKLSAGEGAVAPSLVLGFRRGEAALVPVQENEDGVRSVFGELGYATNATTFQAGEGKTFTVPGPSSGGARIRQVFATGKAAQIFAQSTEGAKKLSNALGVTLAAENKAVPEVLAAKQPAVDAYNAATKAKDQAALDAFDLIAKAAPFNFAGGAKEFFVKASTVAQVKDFETKTKADAAILKYYK